MSWMRGVEVVVSRKDDPSKKTIFSKHRIDFEVRSTVGWPADTASITLYNLSLDEVKFLQSKEFGELTIELRAGYLEETRGEVRGGGMNRFTDSQTSGTSNRVEINKILPSLFVGQITNAVGFRRPPEHITQLFCISKAYGDSTTFRQMRSVPPGMSLRNAMTQMCNDYGFSTISLYGVDDSVLDESLPKGRTFHDTFLPEFMKLLGEHNLMYTMTTGEVQIFPDSYGNKDAVDRMAKDREPVKLDANSVIGNPIAGICAMNLKTFLNPSVQPGMVLDVSPLLGTTLLVNGVTTVVGDDIVLNTDKSIFRWAMEDKYFIIDVVHFGSTHALEYQTAISATLGGNTAMGKDESTWQEMYANSGMASEL